MILQTPTQLVLVISIVATIGCDRVTKYVATTSLAGEPGRSVPADTIRLEYVENQRWVSEPGRRSAARGSRGAVHIWLHGAHDARADRELALRFQWRGAVLLALGSLSLVVRRTGLTA